MKKLFKFFIPLVVLFIFTFIYYNYIRSVGQGTIPVITYHSIDDVTTNEYIIEPAKFEEMLIELNKNDFTYLSLNDVEDIIYNGKKLPKNPIVITFDDGYKDNYTNVFPLLLKHNAKANIFIIGSYVGKDGFLTFDDIQEMAESGHVFFGSHSYNLHDKFLSGPSKGKTYMSAKLEGESDEHYVTKITNDLVWNNELIYERSSVFPTSIAYPGAMVNDLIIKASKDAGLKIGFIGANKTASKLEGINPYKIHRFHIKSKTNIKNMVRFLISNNE